MSHRKSDGIVAFETIEEGDDSGIERPSNDVVRTRDGLEALWRRHNSNKLPSPDVPEIDFQEHMVVCVFRGTMNKGGYGVEVKSIEREECGDEGDVLVFRYETTDPPSWSVTTCAETQPFHIVKTRRSEGGLRFENSAAPPPPRPYPTFILTFDRAGGEAKKADEGYVDKIRVINSVREVQVLFDGEIVMVKFHEDKIDRQDAEDLLRSMDGGVTIEAEPPIS